MPVSHWEFLRQHQLTQLIKQLITQLGFKLFSSGIRQWGIVNSQTYINLPLSASILRYTVSIWDNKDSSHFISVTGTADGYIQIINAAGVSTGTCFYLAITK